MATPVKWNEELRAKVREMWNERGMSASEIGAEFSVSRCAIISLVHRMGLDGFRNSTPEERATLQAIRVRRDRERRALRASQKVEAAPKSAKVKAHMHEVPAPASVLMLNIPFNERRPDQCSWIPGEPGADAICCGLAVKEGTSWCSHHHAMIYDPRALRVVASNTRPNRTTTRYGALRVA